MREMLDAADSSLCHLEAETSIIEERLKEINTILKEIEASISLAYEYDDREVAVSLQKNLSQKQVEYERQEAIKKEIVLQLNQVCVEIGCLRDQNSGSGEEIARMSALGEDVGDSLAVIQERDWMLHCLDQRCQNLLIRLDQVSIQKMQEAQSEWKIPGFVDVLVSDLPDPEGVSSPADFDHHISWENARSAALLLPHIQQELANGKTGDDFALEDLSAGLDWAHGKKRVYDLFYSTNEPIRLEKCSNGYSITSGRHRVYVAKAVGLHTIPAQVIETSRSI